MNERLTPHHEHHESLDLSELSKEKLEETKARAEHLDNDPARQVEHLRHAAQEQAVSGREYTVGEREAAPASHTFGAHKQLKTQSYKRTLNHLQSRLKGPEKTFSKVIHKKTVDRVSAVASQTVARPAGILAGGLCAFIGSLFVLILANRYGFRYNFTLFIILFSGGYLFGSLVELLNRAVKRSR